MSDYKLLDTYDDWRCATPPEYEESQEPHPMVHCVDCGAEVHQAEALRIAGYGGSFCVRCFTRRREESPK